MTLHSRSLFFTIMIVGISYFFVEQFHVVNAFSSMYRCQSATSTTTNVANRIQATRANHGTYGFRLFYINKSNEGRENDIPLSLPSPGVLPRASSSDTNYVEHNSIGQSIRKKNDDSRYVVPFMFAILDMWSFVMTAVGVTLSVGVILNLLGYAYWFTPEHGMVIDTVEHVKMHQELFTTYKMN